MKNIILILSVFLFSLSGCASEEEEYKKGKSQYAIDLVSSKFPDPESIKFENLILFYENAKSEKFIVCGNLNPKNQFGGYAGFRKFAYIDGEIIITLSDQEKKDELLDYSNNYNYSSYEILNNASKQLEFGELELKLSRACNKGFDLGEIYYFQAKNGSVK